MQMEGNEVFNSTPPPPSSNMSHDLNKFNIKISAAKSIINCIKDMLTKG